MSNTSKILFVCSANKQRSKTASDYFSEKLSSFEFDSAGTNHKICNKEGTQPLTENLMEWADLVIVMEEKHRQIITKNGGSHFRRKIKVLHIPDHYSYYQKELITLLEEKAEPLIEDSF
ncbi:phosphotyrosine protein phosphatase [Psychroserpens sp. AS72]|uniref:phosphotyrosine protein phosphatase n=1 Tax=Psychroserpens sp. AS72 TaxID=3135775 RepID=UPI00316B1F8A